MFDKLAYGALVPIKPFHPSQALQHGAYQNGAPFRAFLQAPGLGRKHWTRLGAGMGEIEIFPLSTLLN
jgi:hypothetical protein